MPMTSLLTFLVAMAGCGALEWAYDVTLGDHISLYCNDSTYNPDPNDTIAWYKETFKGDTTAISKGRNSEKYEINARDDVDGIELVIDDVTVGDFGLYRCEVMNGSHTLYVRKGVNLSGQVYGSLLGKYRGQLEVAGVAGGSALGLFVLIFVVSRFRHKGPGFGREGGDVDTVTVDNGVTSEDATTAL